MNKDGDYQVSSAENIELTGTTAEGCAVEVHISCSHDSNLEFGEIYQGFLNYPYFITHQFIDFLDLITMESENIGMQR